MKVFGITIGSDDSGGAPLVVGGLPEVDLLPHEVRDARRSRSIRRGFVAAAVVCVGIAIAGGVAAKFVAVGAEARLFAAEARTQQLLAQQAEFAEVTTLQDEIAQHVAARHVITSTELDWRELFTQIRGMLPAGATVIAMDADGASPMELYAQASAPLQGPRIATIRFTVQSTSMLSVPAFVDQLEGLPGFVDHQVPSTTAVETGVETSFVVHLDERAYADRFPVETAQADGADAVDGSGGTEAEASVDASTEEEEAN